MRGIRILSGALIVLLLGACGGKPFPTVAPPAGGNSAAAGVTVHLGSDPRLAPVERLLNASKGRFNAGLFISAFDISAQPCNVIAIAQRVEGAATSPPIDVATARVVSVHSRGVTGRVELADKHPYYLRLRHVNGEWVVDENACLWIGEVEGGQLPESIANGMTRLAASDPRRAPAAALLASLTEKFDAATFISAFDLGEQPCDVRTMAREIGNGTATGNPPVAARFYVRSIGPQQDAVVVEASGGALALRIHEINGRWRLNEDACTWLVDFDGAAAGADERAVQSDLRNALTAEKTIYTDTQMYNTSPETMKQIEPALDWGGRLQISVGDAVTPGDRNVVCLTESSASGTTLSIADVAVGQYANTYYSTKPCPVPLTASSVGTHHKGFSSGG